MVTAAASERGAGSDPVTRAVPVPENAWTVPTVAGDPPPKTSARPWETHPGGIVQRGAERADPLGRPRGGPQAYTPLADVLADVSPPSTMSWPGDPGTTTSRPSGAARCHGSKPDSAASRMPGVPAARAGGGAARAGVLRAPGRAPGAAARADREPRDNGDDDHGERRGDGTPAAHGAAACRLPAPGARLPGPGPGGLPGSGRLLVARLRARFRR